MKSKLLIDLDGTILNGVEVINKSRDFIEILKNKNIDFLVMTNSVKSPKLIKSRLLDTGIDIKLNSIINPITAINSFLTRNNIKKTFIVGSEKEQGQVATIHDKNNPEIIMLLDFERENYSFTYLQEIFELLQRGIPIISASGSPYYISKDKQVLDTGSFVSLFESVINKKIDIFGKPSELYYKEALEILKCNPNEVLVIGDDWKTDAQGAINSGLEAVLVKSGKYKDGDEYNVSGVKTIESLLEVLDL